MNYLIVKICQCCGAILDWDEFMALEQLGIQEFDGEKLQYANCKCKTTLAVGIDDNNRPKWDSLVSEDCDIWQYNFED